MSRNGGAQIEKYKAGEIGGDTLKMPISIAEEESGGLKQAEEENKTKVVSLCWATGSRRGQIAPLWNKANSAADAHPQPRQSGLSSFHCLGRNVKRDEWIYPFMNKIHLFMERLDCVFIDFVILSACFGTEKVSLQTLHKSK